MIGTKVRMFFKNACSRGLNSRRNYIRTNDFLRHELNRLKTIRQTKVVSKWLHICRFMVICSENLKVWFQYLWNLKRTHFHFLKSSFVYYWIFGIMLLVKAVRKIITTWKFVITVWARKRIFSSKRRDRC